MGVKLSRDLRPGTIVVVHLTTGTSVRGRVLRLNRSVVTLAEHSVEMNGTMVEATSKRLLVPVPLVQLVEVVA